LCLTVTQRMESRHRIGQGQQAVQVIPRQSASHYGLGVQKSNREPKWLAYNSGGPACCKPQLNRQEARKGRCNEFGVDTFPGGHARSTTRTARILWQQPDHPVPSIVPAFVRLRLMGQMDKASGRNWLVDLDGFQQLRLGQHGVASKAKAGQMNSVGRASSPRRIRILGDQRLRITPSSATRLPALPPCSSGLVLAQAGIGRHRLRITPSSVARLREQKAHIGIYLALSPVLHFLLSAPQLSAWQ